MAAHDAGCGTRHIGQDAIEQLAIPPVTGLRIAGLQGACRVRRYFAACARRRSGLLKLQTLQIFGNPRQAPGIVVERDQLYIGGLQQMPGLAARRRAGVQHPHPILHVEQGRGQLRCCVLHRYQPVHEAGNLAHRQRFFQPHCTRADLGCCHAVGFQQSQIIGHGGLANIDAQGQRRRRIASLQNRLPILRIRGLGGSNPPGRIIPNRRRLLQRFLQQRVAFAQETPQNRIHHAFRVRHIAMRRRCRNSLIDHGENFVRQRFSSIVRCADQCQRAAQQAVQNGRIGLFFG